VVFHPLNKEQITEIAKIQLSRLYKRMEEQGYQVKITEAALSIFFVRSVPVILITHKQSVHFMDIFCKGFIIYVVFSH
ncbi:MAG: hypothetical protein ACTS8Y_03455, partial [Arsenophonus sp. ER-EMS1-MAG3]